MIPKQLNLSNICALLAISLLVNKGWDLIVGGLFIKWYALCFMPCIRILVFEMHNHPTLLSKLQFTYGGRCVQKGIWQNLLFENKIYQAAFTRGRFTCKYTNRNRPILFSNQEQLCKTSDIEITFYRSGILSSLIWQWKLVLMIQRCWISF